MRKNIIKLLAAAVVYAAFAVYLYQPYFDRFSPTQFLILINVTLAALGGFVLSRRWVGLFAGSFFAGAIYGFGPFFLWFSSYHASVSLLAAAVPWLFCPAAFVPRTKRWNWLSRPLSALPFAVIVLFFEVSAKLRLFAIPMQTSLQLSDLSGLLAPLVMAQKGSLTLGFYHVPVAMLVMGVAMLFAARRFGIMAIFVLGTIPAFCPAVLNVSPLIWLTIPTLCCAGLVGAGMQGLIFAGAADRKMILAIAIFIAAISIGALLAATGYCKVSADLAEEYGKLLTMTAKMYMLSAVAMAMLFFVAWAKLRIHWLRLAILCSLAALDIFLGARFIVDKVF